MPCDDSFCVGKPRLEKAVLDAVANEPPEVKTPDLKGTGTTRSFTDAVIKRL